jgi:hypothetical protein
VEFSADFDCLKPRDPQARQSCAAVRGFEPRRQGHAGDVRFSNDPRNESDFGDGFLLEQGYTLVWLGWEFDVPPGPNACCGSTRRWRRASRGWCAPRSRWIARRRAQSLGDRSQLAYPALNPDDPRADAHRARARRWRAARGSAGCLAHRGRHAHRDAGGLRARQDLRTGVHVQGPADRGAGSGGGARPDLVLQLRHRKRHDSGRSTRLHQAGLRIRHFPERPFPAHVLCITASTGTSRAGASSTA